MGQELKHPMDVAEALCRIVGITEQQQIEDCTDIVYNLHTTAENEHNSDDWRTFYAVLSRIAEMEERNELGKDY